VTDDHLTDRQLQEYLDGIIDKSDPLVRHLDSCPRCRQALQEYKQLYTTIENEPVPELSPAFADNVLARLPETAGVSEAETFAGRFRLRDSLVFFIAVAAVIAAAVYFVDLSSILKPFAGAAASKPDFSDNRLLASLLSEIRLLDFDISIVTFVILTLLGIGAIDRIIRHRTAHRKTISYLV